MQISLVISALTCGGAERVLTTMAGHFADQGHSVRLITLAGAHPPFYPLHPDVHVLSLNVLRHSANLLQTVANTLHRVQALRRAFREDEPNVVISFMDTTNVLCLWATRGLGVPVLVTEHIDPALHKIGRLRNLLRRFSYPLAKNVIVLTPNVISYFPADIRKKCLAVPNPIVVEPEGEPSLTPDRPAIMAMGRLAHQKGFDFLLQAFALVAPRFPEWTLYIAGEGDMREELEASISALGLAQRIRLPGNLSDPHPFLALGEIFVLPSRYEGFPMALCEAMALGLPAVATRYSVGIENIIRDGDNGLLVPVGDIQALAAAIERLMADAALRGRLAHRAKASMERYSVEQVMRSWDALLLRATQPETPNTPHIAAGRGAQSAKPGPDDDSRPRSI